MANGIGRFASLAPAQIRVAQAAQSAVDPLTALIQGFQQGQALQQLPQQLAQQQIAQQLALELQQERLADIRDPNRAIAREFQKQLVLSSLDPTSGVRRSGVGAVPTGEIEPIFGVSGEETPFVLDPERAAAARLRARSATSPPFQVVGVSPTSEGVTQGVVFNPATGNFEARPLPSGVTEIRPKTTRPTTGARALTETARANLLNRAGKFGVLASDQDLDKFRTESGELDIAKLSVATGRAEREGLATEKEAKLNQAPSEVRSKVAAYQAVQKDLETFRSRLDEELQSGEIPSALQDIISAGLAESPGGFFGRIWQRFILQPAQSKTAAGNERLRGAVSASIGRAIAGAALTGTEKQNLIPFTPQAGDSFERLLEKSAGLEQFLANQIEGLTAPIPRGGQPVISPVATPGISPTAPTPVRSGNTFRIIR